MICPVKNVGKDKLRKGGHRGVLKKLTQKRSFYKVIL